MEIRRASRGELPALLALYADARRFMAAQGNPHQWGDAFPPRAAVEDDIARGQAYVCVEDGAIAAAFSFRQGEEAAYRAIRAGAWPDDGPYGVVHRFASARTVPGAAAFSLEWCLRQCGRLRIDTHWDNRPMRALLQKLGFAYCGLIDLENGRGERLAYQKTR